MAEAKLNFDEAALDKSTGLYDLYSRFYEGMRTANLCDGPDYVSNPPLTESGEIDAAAIAEGLANHSTILMKNSAYMMANAIMSSVSGGGSGAGRERNVAHNQHRILGIQRNVTEPSDLLS